MGTVSISSELSADVASARLLIADDHPHILAALEFLLGGEGYQTHFASSPVEVLSALETGSFDTILLDLNYTRDTTGGSEGLDLVSRIRDMDANVPLIALTAWSSVGLAVEAMRRGASDFIQKPWNNSELLEKVREQVGQCRLRRNSRRLQDEESLAAREIQQRLLPANIPQIFGYDISAVSRPLQSIGGDYYDVVRISDTQTAICMADVAGKGLPGALLMSNLQAALKPLIHSSIEPRELCDRLNRILCDIMPDNKFISFFYAVLDSHRNHITYCNAGHNPPLLVHPDGSWFELRSTGAILGKFPDWNYGQHELRLKRDDTLVLFTDGVVEACDECDEPFGESRLAKCVRQSDGLRASQLQAKLFQNVSQHCHGQFQDDATMIVLQSL